MCARHNGFFYRFRLPFQIIGVILVIVLGLGFFYGLTLLGPRKVDPNALVVKRDSKEAEELLEKSELLEQQFADVVGLREATDEDLALIQDAIALQKDYLSSMGGHDREASDRLDSLETVYQDSVAKGIMVESVDLEIEATRLVEQGKSKEALRHLKRAFQLQKRINEEFPLSSSRNITRVAQLERQVDQMTARPTYERSLLAEEEAQKAMEASDWNAAKKSLAEAISLQKEINMEFRQLQYANVNRLKDLEVELASLKSSGFFDEIESLVTAAEARVAAKEYRKAAELYQKAARAQNKLNREFPDSRFASAAKMEELEGLNQNALSQELSEEINAEIAELDAHLLGRRTWQAVGIINGLYEKAQRFKESFPKSTIMAEDTLLKLQYLSFVQSDIGLFQDKIYGQLVPLPSVKGQSMLKTEVSQALYSSIMLNNPSRNRGELFPVDSVNWEEAKEFCQKVSWILSREVTLPSQEDFRDAVGSLKYVKLDDVAWFEENSLGDTKHVGSKSANKNGFNDLLGNVNEWLLSSDLPGAAEGYVAGGSSQDSIDVVADIPVVIVNKRSRNRMTGFRFVVNTEE